MTGFEGKRYHFFTIRRDTIVRQARRVASTSKGSTRLLRVGALGLRTGKVSDLDKGERFAGLAAEESAPLIIEKRSRGNATVLDIEGSIKLGESAEFFSQALENVLHHEKGHVIIDFSGINQIDSTGIGELIGYLSKFSSEHRQVLIVNPSQRILKLLKIVRLDKVFRIFPEEDSALAYAEGRDPGQ